MSSWSYEENHISNLDFFLQVIQNPRRRNGLALLKKTQNDTDAERIQIGVSIGPSLNKCGAKREGKLAGFVGHKKKVANPPSPISVASSATGKMNKLVQVTG